MCGVRCVEVFWWYSEGGEVRWEREMLTTPNILQDAGIGSTNSDG